MVTLATQADLEAVRGPVYLLELLRVAEDRSADEATRATQRAARLAEALQAGDDLISQFLDIEAIKADDVATRVCRRLAIDEAFYYLQCSTRTGADDADHTKAQIRRHDLAAMRKREQFPGRPIGQASIRSGFVPSASPFSRARLVGFR